MANLLPTDLVIGATLSSSVSAVFGTLDLNIKSSTQKVEALALSLQTLTENAMPQPVAMPGMTAVFAAWTRSVEVTQNATASAQRCNAAIGDSRTAYTGLNAELERTSAKMGLLEKLQTESAKRGPLLSSMKQLVAPDITVAKPIQSAMSFETALNKAALSIEGMKNSAGGLTPKYQEMETAIKQMGRELPLTHEQLAGLFAAGGKQGFSGMDELKEFVTTASQLSLVSGMSTDEAAAELQRYSTEMGLSVAQTSAMLDLSGRMAERGHTSADAFAVLGNRVGELSTTVGMAALPMLTGMMDTVGPLISGLTDLAAAHPAVLEGIWGMKTAFDLFRAGGMGLQYVLSLARSGGLLLSGILSGLSSAVGVTTSAFSTLRGGVGGLVTAFTNSSAAQGMLHAGGLVLNGTLSFLRGAADMTASGFSFLFRGLSSLAGAIRQTTVVQWALNAVMTANPIGLVVAGVAALAGWFAYAYSQTGSLTGAVSLMWEQFKAVVPTMELLESVVVGAVQFVTDFFNGVSLYDAGARWVTTLVDGFMSMIDGFIAQLQWVKDAVSDFFGLTDNTSAKTSDGEISRGKAPKTGRPVMVAAADATTSVMTAMSANAATRLITAPAPKTASGVPAVGASATSVAAASVQPATRWTPNGALPPGTSPAFASPGHASGSFGGSGMGGSGRTGAMGGVSANLTFNISGITDSGFATRVVDALQSRRGDFERMISDIVHDQQRVSYAS